MCYFTSAQSATQCNIYQVVHVIFNTQSAPLSRWRDKICIIIVLDSFKHLFSRCARLSHPMAIIEFNDIQSCSARRDKECIGVCVAATPAASVSLQLFQLDLLTQSLFNKRERGYLAIKMIEWVAAAASELSCAPWQLYWALKSSRSTFIHH